MTNKTLPPERRLSVTLHLQMQHDAIEEANSTVPLAKSVMRALDVRSVTVKCDTMNRRAFVRPASQSLLDYISSCPGQLSLGRGGQITYRSATPARVAAILSHRSAVSRPRECMNRLTFCNRCAPMSAGNVRASATVSSTRRLTAKTRRCCWSRLAPMPRAASSCHT